MPQTPGATSSLWAFRSRLTVEGLQTRHIKASSARQAVAGSRRDWHLTS